MRKLNLAFLMKTEHPAKSGPWRFNHSMKQSNVRSEAMADTRCFPKSVYGWLGYTESFGSVSSSDIRGLDLIKADTVRIWI